MKTRFTISATFVVFFYAAPFLFAQDVHFSQFDAILPQNAPAMTGFFVDNAYQSGALSYRNQWQTVPVAYNSVLGTWQRALSPLRRSKNYVGIGLSLLHDAAGDAQLGLTQINASAAYHLPLATGHTLSIGATAGYGRRQMNTQNLRFDAQFNGDVYDGSRTTDETYNATNFGFFDASAGIAWHYANAKKGQTFGLSGAIMHINQPIQSFYAVNSAILPHRYSFLQQASLPLAARWRANQSLQYMQQAGAQELQVNVLFDYALNQQRFAQTHLLFGGGYRLNDAAVTMLGIRLNAWRAVLSYDINTSPFRVATRSVGAFELSLQHLWYVVVPNPKLKACPLY